MPYASIFDVVFYGRKLYGVTQSNDLVVMDIGDDDDGIPIVKNIEYVITHPPGDEEEEEQDEDEDEEYEYHQQVPGNDDEEKMEYNEASSTDEDDQELDKASIINKEDGLDDDKVAMNKLANKDSDFNVDDHEELSSNEDEENVNDEDYDDGSSIMGDYFCESVVPNFLDYMVPDGTEQLPCAHGEDQYVILTSRHIFESNGRILMLRRQQYVPVFSCPYNLKVEVLEADVNAGVWVARTDGVQGAFFASNHYSKHVSAYNEAGKEFIHHFVDEHNVGVDSRSRRYTLWDGKPTWFFPQEPVV
ncbi:hypothetical protein ZWY2020_059840 [Hordeum vulgare]|nr:hypothetical protein ZWY2020_059840 [Hordeum vulgare]